MLMRERIDRVRREGGGPADLGARLGGDDEAEAGGDAPAAE